LVVEKGRGQYFGWKDYAVLKMTLSENPFTRGVERGETLPPLLLSLVLKDLKRLMQLMNDPWPENHIVGRWLGKIHQKDATEPFLLNRPYKLMKKLCSYHKMHGTGIFLHNPVFKLDEKGTLVPIVHYEQIGFDQ